MWRLARDFLHRKNVSLFQNFLSLSGTFFFSLSLQHFSVILPPSQNRKHVKNRDIKNYNLFYSRVFWGMNMREKEFWSAFILSLTFPLTPPTLSLSLSQQNFHTHLSHFRFSPFRARWRDDRSVPKIFSLPVSLKWGRNKRERERDEKFPLLNIIMITLVIKVLQ